MLLLQIMTNMVVFSLSRFISGPYRVLLNECLPSQVKVTHISEMRPHILGSMHDDTS